MFHFPSTCTSSIALLPPYFWGTLYFFPFFCLPLSSLPIPLLSGLVLFASSPLQSCSNLISSCTPSRYSFQLGSIFMSAIKGKLPCEFLPARRDWLEGRAWKWPSLQPNVISVAYYFTFCMLPFPGQNTSIGIRNLSFKRHSQLFSRGQWVCR